MYKKNNKGMTSKRESSLSPIISQHVPSISSCIKRQPIIFSSEMTMESIMHCANNRPSFHMGCGVMRCECDAVNDDYDEKE